MKKAYTFLILSNGRQSTKKLVIPQSRFVAIGILAACLAMFASALVFDYVYLLYKDHEEKWIRAENQALKAEIAGMEAKLNALEKSFERIDLFSKKLKMITQVESPSRDLQLAMGPSIQTARVPVFKAAHASTSVDNLEKFSQVSPGLSSGEVSVMGMRDYGSLIVRLDRTLGESRLREQNLLSLWQNLSDRIGILAATPSIKPTSGWISSKFGYRRSPLSGASVMHKGLDIAANFGTKVVAPADGIVSYVGYDGGYGKLISIDHGYGVVTRYGHNARIHVKYGQRVNRGAHIADVGNTGRSSGPHLHYEVRVNGIPVDPQKYILQ